MALESEALEVFRKVNPSHAEIEQPEVWRAFATRLAQRFTYEYRLPPTLLRGRSVLDVGCGTGEKSLVMASWGAGVVGMDFNEDALARARALAVRAKVPNQPVFVQGAVSALPEQVRARSFDVVYADGVLHHGTNQKASLRNLAARVAPGGFLVVRNYHPLTALQRLLKRAIARWGSDGEHEAIAAAVRRLFAEDVQRSVELGGRGEQQAIYDNYVAPYEPLGEASVLEVCAAEGLRVYAVSPAVDAAALLGPGPLLNVAQEPEPLVKAWWAASVARTLIATDPAPKTLEHAREPLEACARSAAQLEVVLGRFVESPGAQSWNEVASALDGYLAGFDAVLEALVGAVRAQRTAFDRDVQAVSTALRHALMGGRPVERLPDTSILFKRMSGMPMACWVLARPDAEHDAGPLA
jgi:2-polyprenyl-3-methyl-5-hydroxy-6-metoxy-1,4-benzoquinol methylase